MKMNNFIELSVSRTVNIVFTKDWVYYVEF